MKEDPPKQLKKSKVEVSMSTDSEDPQKFAQERLVAMKTRIARRLDEARLAAASQEPKPEPAAEPAVVPDASVGSSPDVTVDPVNPDAGAPASQVDNEVDVSGLRPGRRRKNKQQPAPVTLPAQSTPAATVLPADPTPPVADLVVDSATSTTGDIPADMKLPDDVARDMQIKQIDQLLNLPGIDDATRAKLEALKKSSVISDTDLAALQKEIQDMNASVSNTGVVGGLQPKRRANKLNPADAPAAAAGGIPAGIDQNSLPVSNNPLSGDFDKKYNIEGMTLAPKDGDSLPAPETTVSPETLTTPEAPKEETAEAGVMSEVERLKVMVGEARLQYVTTDYNQDSWWKKFKNVLGAKNLGDRNDVDTQSAFQMYTHALTEYQNAQLTEMEKEGLTPEERSKRMAGMLKFLKADEFLEMKKARHQVKLEGMTKAEKVIEAFEKVGQWYNKLPKKAKFAASAAVLALGTGTLVAGSPLFIAGGTGLVFCKRLVTTAGLAVSANNLIEGWQEDKMKNRAESDIEEDLSIILAKDKNVESDWETQKARFQMVLEKDRDALDTRFGKLKNQDRLRRLGAWGGATALVFGASAVSAAMSSSGPGLSQIERDKLDFDNHNPAPGARVPRVEGVASAARAAGAPASTASAAARMAEVASAPASDTGTVATNGLLDGTNQHLKEYVVTAADGKRGLWGIIDNRLPNDIPKGPGRDRMIQSLENIMRAKLDALSPEERVKLGFPKSLPNGMVNLDFIKVGDTIGFSKLLTSQEIQSVLDGKSIGAPSGVGHLLTQNPDGGLLNKEEIVEAKRIFAESQAMDKAEYEDKVSMPDVTGSAVKGVIPTPHEDAGSGIPEKSLAGVLSSYENTPAPSIPRVSAKEMVLDSAKENFNLSSLNTPQGFATFYTEHPTEMHRTFVRIGSDVFRTPEVLMEAKNHFDVSPYTYKRATLGRVQMSWVHQTLGEMRAGVTRFVPNNLRFPLHPSQMENLMRLTTVVQDPKIFGIAGRPLYGETVNDYMSRMSAYAVATGKEEKLTAFLYGRR